MINLSLEMVRIWSGQFFLYSVWQSFYYHCFCWPAIWCAVFKGVVSLPLTSTFRPAAACVSKAHSTSQLCHQLSAGGSARLWSRHHSDCCQRSHFHVLWHTFWFDTCSMAPTVLLLTTVSCKLQSQAAGVFPPETRLPLASFIKNFWNSCSPGWRQER